MEKEEKLKKILSSLAMETMSVLEAQKRILNLFEVRNSFCKHDGCTDNSTCGDFCYRHCTCNKGKK